MRESSATELRDLWVERLRETVEQPPFGVAPPAGGPPGPNLALGVSGEGDRHRLAVRLQDRSAATLAAVEAITETAEGEVEVREIGEVVALAPVVRPLVGGISIGNAIGNSGTLGCIVRKRGTTGPDFLLSNNHVLARIGFAELGESIEQPAASDQTGAGPFAVAEFGEAVALSPRPTPNRVDAAVVPVLAGVHCQPGVLFGSTHRLAGVRTAAARTDDKVFKVGKSTELTEGRILGQGMRMLTVKMGSLRFDFDDQIEIVPKTPPFCLAGDSGSIVFDESDLALGLLFARSPTSDLAYVNPIAAVLSALNLELA